MKTNIFFIPRAVCLLGIITAGGTACFPGTAAAQNLTPPPLSAGAGSARITGSLLELVRTIPAASRAKLSGTERGDLRTRAKAQHFTLRDDDSILVEIIGPPTAQLDRDLDLAKLLALGIEIGRPVPGALAPAGGRAHVPLSRSATRAEAWLPLTAISRIEPLLPPGYRIRPVKPLKSDQVVGEGPVRTNSSTYATGNANGTDLTIAVIDSGFDGLTAARNNGDAPNATLINLTTNADFESGTNDHGTGCVEAAFDHAPGARWRLYRMDTVADYNAIVTDCIANGVDIISHSLSQYNEGWGDGTGPACQEATRAGQNGILFFTSCGNRADSHYEGAFVDADGDGLHEFPGGDETIDVTIAMGAAAGGSHYLSWSNSGSDFDLILYNSALDVVTSSETVGIGVFEEFDYTNPGASATFHLSVRRRSGSANSIIEIFSHNSATWLQHAVAAGSNTSPSNTNHPNVISVGAVTQASYGSAAGTNVISSYSSRGPSNSGEILPILCGPTDTTGFTYPGGFGGTSCATPNAAGAACAFWSADTNLTANGVSWLLLRQAAIYRDWGAAGNESVYGSGGLRLIDFRTNTRWLARSYPGGVDNGSVPFHTLAGAQNNMPQGGRLLVFGSDFGTFPEPITLGSLGRAFDIQTVPGTSHAILGQ